ncbi:arsenate reductase/protein-tyrosine-phosphatase family protein [Mycolicibacterium sp. CBM1]
MHVLFVCTGNICRSPIAERLAAAQAERLGISGFTASSAGTRAVVSHPIQREAAGVLKALGGDPSNFAARQLTTRIAREADLVLTMTRAHRDVVLELAPRQLHKTFTLTEAARLTSEYQPITIADLAVLRPRVPVRDLPDIPDPIGGPPEFFTIVGAQIADALQPVIQLCRRASTQT